MKTAALHLIPIICGLLPSMAFAQAAAVAPTTTETVELSPFVIQAELDDGYAPNETLAGTRLRTQTKDVAASMTIVTPELMRDLGAIDFNDVTNFLPSTASFANNEGDQFNNGSRTGTPFIVRGYRSDSLSLNFFNTLTQIDTYNTTRLTFSRGPNSILFGVGNPGGALDATTKRARLDRASAELDLLADSFGGRRGAIDVNSILVPGKLALRLDLLKSDRGNNIKPSENKRDSAFLTATYQPVKTTTVITNVELNHIRLKLPRPYEYFDWYNTWAAAGKPIIPKAATTTAVNGVEFQVGNGYPVYIPGIGAMDWSKMALGARPLIKGVRDPQVSYGAGSPNRIVPLDTYIVGDADNVNYDTQNYSVVVEQELGHGLNLELGGQFEHAFRMSLESNGADDAIKVDPNAQLPNGAPNPHVGMAYTDQIPVRTPISTNDAQLRATLSYEKDFSKIKVFDRGLGRLMLAGLYNNEFVHQYLDKYRETNTTPLPVAASTDQSLDRNAIRRRVYFEPGVTYLTTDYSPSTGNGIVSGWQPYSTPRNNITRTKSYSFAGQMLFLDDFVALTGGMRRDEALVAQAAYAKDAQGLFRTGARGGTEIPEINSVGRPYLYGLVLNAQKNVRLFINRSTNFQPVNQSFHTVFGDPLPAVRGRGLDTGFKFFLFDNKISGSFTYFETRQENLRDSALTASPDTKLTWINQIWTAIDPSHIPADPSWTDVKTQKTHGIEFQLVANPTPNLRLMFNASRDINVAEARGLATIAYLNLNLPVWTAHASTPVSSADGKTVGDLVTKVQQEVVNDLQQVGIRQTRVYEWQANAVARYQFDRRTALKGFAVGTAYRWRNAPVIGFASNGALLDITHPFYGRDSSNLDAWLEYNRVLQFRNKKIRWTAQLRAQDLLGDSTLQPWTATDDGTGHAFIEQRRAPTEREWVLSSTFAL